MGDRLMEFTVEQFESIGEYVRTHINEWISRNTLERLEHLHERDLEKRERMVRMESELKGGREILKNTLHMMGTRFEQVDKRFEQVDKRFEQVLDQVDKRFEQVDKRFEQVDKRFEQVDRRFEEMRTDMNARFEEQRIESDRRFNRVDQRFNRLYTFLSGIFLTMLAGFISLIIKMY